MVERRHAYATEAIEAMLLPRVQDICARLAPDGRKEGHEWVALNPTRADRKAGSFRINLHTGRWADFADSQAASSREFPCLSLISYLATAKDFGKAILWAKDWLGLTGRAPDPERVAAIDAEAQARRAQRLIEENATKERKRKAAHAIWLNGQAVEPHEADPVGSYFLGRGIDLARLPSLPGAIRYNPLVRVATLTGQAHAAMVSAMHMEGAPDGFAAVHVTYIAPGDDGWRKAFGKDSKKIMGSRDGSCVRLTKGVSGKPLASAPAGEWVAISEGIENGLSAAILKPELRVLAAGTVGNIGKVKLPPQIGGVKIIADNDRLGSPANMALENAANMLVDRGLDIEIFLPPRPFKDFNEALVAQGAVV